MKQTLKNMRIRKWMGMKEYLKLTEYGPERYNEGRK